MDLEQYIVSYWEQYIEYLHSWANDHRDGKFEGMCPACYEEWLDNEAEEEDED